MVKVIVSVILAILITPSLFAHCDSVKGPVVVEAQKALDKGDVAPVLKWVPAAQEKEIRAAFAKAVAARKEGAAARELADQWFFETLVRVHRASEGAPYTGLKGAEFKPEPGIELADAAIESGSLESTEKAIVADVTAGLRKRFAEVKEAKAHAAHDVEAGRHYVHAYVEFIHYVERLHESATTAAHAAGGVVAEKH